jgi:2-oxoisovalerate dehydrogenase E2 component (dihydrolipoyl transacylase)
VQSDKASVEITSRFAGVVKKLYYDAGEVARVGKPFVDIDVKEEEEEGDGGSQGASASESAAATPEVQAESSMPDPRAPKELVQPELESAQTPPPPPQQQQQHQHQQRPKGKAAHISTPAVRYLAQQHGVDIAEIDGTGKDGRVTKEDLQKFVRERPSSSSSSASSLSTSQPQQSQQQPPPPPSSSPKAPSEQQETVHKMTNTQAQMFKTMTRSLAIPHFLYSDEVDFSALHELRVRLNRALAQSPPVAAPSVAKLTYLPFLIKAVSMALHQYPILNARVDTSTPTPSIILRSAHNVGVAMDTPSGLVVPVVRDVAARSVLDIAAELARLQALALAGKLGLRDLSGGTITVERRCERGSPSGECYSAPRNVLVPSEDRALCKDAGVMATSGPSFSKPELDTHSRTRPCQRRHSLPLALRHVGRTSKGTQEGINDLPSSEML